LHLGHVAPPFGLLLANDFPGIVEESVRFLKNRGLVENEKADIKINEDNFFFADPGAFKVFSWQLVQGDPSRILEEANSLVLSRRAAQRYFGNENPLGKTLVYDGQAEFLVKGVMQDVPANSHFHPDIIASFKAVENMVGSTFKRHILKGQPVQSLL